MERKPVLTTQEVQAFIDEVFPQQKGILFCTSVGSLTATARMKIGYEHLRPGGTVSGPAMFTVADCAFYMAVLAMIGRQALTVTSNMSINFLRKPEPGTDLTCDARILKLGKLLATGDATVYSAGQEAPVAHASVTYATPPSR